MFHLSFTTLRSNVAAALLMTLFVGPVLANETTAPTNPGMELVSVVPLPNTLNLERLVERLRQTPAISLFQKLDLQFRLDELLAEIAGYEGGYNPVHDQELRSRFDKLVSEVLYRLRDSDRRLYREISHSRHALWVAVVRNSSER